MKGEFEVGGHALNQFRARFSDPAATWRDVSLILEGCRVTKREWVGGELFVYAVLEDACFVLKRLRPGRYRVITSIRLEGMDKFYAGVENVA